MNNFPDDEIAISAQGLRCSYGSFEAVRGIDLSIRNGEFFALLGTNGAGKTTTMETLEGHRPASAGTVRVLGGDPFAHKALIRPRLGIMLQEAGFADDLTVTETVDLWLRQSSSPRGAAPVRKSTIAEALETLELADKSSTRVKQLSGGQRRRLDLVLATVNQPEVLFLDEPTTGLDPESRQRTWAVVNAMHRQGTTVLLTTHYLEEATQYAERLAIMHDGVIALSGSVAEVLAAEPAAISFSVAADTSLAGLNPNATVQPENAGQPENTGQRVQLRTSNLQAELHALLSWAASNSITLERLKASEASLDEVFRRVSSGASNPESTYPALEASV